MTKQRKLKEEYSDNIQIFLNKLEFILSLPVEQKITKVTDLSPVIATKEHQEEMEKSINKNKINQLSAVN